MNEYSNENAPPRTPEQRGGIAIRDPHKLYNKNPETDFDEAHKSYIEHLERGNEVYANKYFTH